MFEVLGQEFIIGAFHRVYENNKVSHAYIIIGPDGIGKSILALHMAAVLLCRGEEKPCEKCASCQKITHGNHPDVKTLSLKGKSIGVDEIRNLIDDIYTKPYEGDRKVIIIKAADHITIQGQNAILKSLEEPALDTTIIMLAENENAILETIKSRCQVLRLGKVAVEAIKQHVIHLGVDSKKAQIAANLSDGILGNALKFLDDKYTKLRQEVINRAIDVVNKDTLTILRSADFFVNNKDKIEIILDIMTSWYRDIIMLKLSNSNNNLANNDFYELLVEESQKLSYNRLDSIINEINSARDKIRKNANFQLTIEIMLLNIQEG